MDLENERIIKLIFPNGVPDNLCNNPDLYKYLDELGTYKVEQLKKEQSRLVVETKNIEDQTQELAISNYKSFIGTAENSRSIFQEFQNAEAQIDTLIEKLPKFKETCDFFFNKSAKLNNERRLNSITLQKNAQLLEILEIPQLMERCIRESRYEEALELASYVQKLGHHHGDIAVIKSIALAVEDLWHTMLVQLLAQLRTDLQLPKCLQIVGFLRRMQAFKDSELKLKFLQARDTWLKASLKAINETDAQQQLSKTIEVTRINLFNIITQYRAIFPEVEVKESSLKSLHGVSSNGDRLFEVWLHEKIKEFLINLEENLMRGINSFETVLDHCMYFGLSFSRVGADFRALMVPIFVRVISHNFERRIANVNQIFACELDKYTLINKVTLHTRKHADSLSTHQLHTPPETLLDFLPLATLCNGYINTLNEFRLYAPIALTKNVTNCLQQSLELVAQRVLAFYRQEQQAFTGNERETFSKFCSCFAYDLVPYIQHCIHAVFPQQTLSTHLGINLLMLEQLGITYLDQTQILKPLKHLLPAKVDIILQPEDTISRTLNANVNTDVTTEA